MSAPACLSIDHPSPTLVIKLIKKLYSNLVFCNGIEILALAINNLIRLVMGIVDILHLMRPLTMPISCRYQIWTIYFLI